jgi:adhesin HecA-like repeat protein
VSSKDITVSASSGAISNSGEFNAAQSLMLTSQGDITNNGGISSNNLQVSSLTGSIKNYGNVYTLGKMMLLPVKGLFNYAAGKIGADGGMEIETQGTVTNEGKLCAHGALKITATQTIENKPGAQIEADQINANTNDKIINYGHIYMAGGTSLLKSVNEFINNANIYSRGSFAIESSRFTNVQNALIDADTLSVKTAGDIVNNAKLYSKDSLTLNSGGKTENAQTGNISASPSGNIHIVSAGAVNNWWAIIAGGQINIQSSREIFNGGSVGSQAVISGGGLTQIKSGERIINYGYIQSVNGNLKLESSSAINWDYRLNDNGNERLNNIRRYLSQMRTDNKNDASLIRTGIHNYGRLYSRADMELNSKSVLHNNVNSLIYSVGSINFNVKEILYNNAAAIGTGIYAQRDINVSGDYGRINKLINYNGYIEAGGNIRISANEVINYGSDNIDIFAYPYAATDGGRRKELDVHVETRGTTVARLEYTSTLTSQESQIIAKSGWADINAQSSITNYNSTIYGGAGLNLTAGTVINSVGEFEVTFTNYRKRRVDLNFGARFFGGFKRGQEYRNIANSYDNEVLKSNNAKARLMSGRTVSITTNRLYNGSLSDKKGEVNQWKKESVSQEWTGIHSNVPSYGGQGVGAQTGGKYEPSYIGNGAVIDITKNLQLPRGSYGKYKPSTSPIYLYETDVLLRDMPRVNKPSTNPHNLYETDISLTDIPRVNKPSIKTHYLYETDASLRDETTFLGSQYFLNRIGLDPFNMEYKFLGDSYMEHDMLSRSLQEQGFLENLHHTPGDIDIFIERAYQSLDARKVNDMGLEFGKELTEEQINALSQDIVWYVLKGIELPNGETVQTLVPQIYLCQDTVNKLKMPQRVFEETQERVSQQQAQDIGSARAKAKGNEIAQHQMDQITKEAQEEAKTKVWQDVNNFISNNSDEYNKMVEKAYKKIQGSYNSLGESFAKNLPVFSRKTRQELMEIAKKQVNDALLDQMARETLDVYTQEISKFKEEAVIRATYDKVYEQFYQEELVKARQRNVVGINNTSLISGNDVVIQSLDGKGGVVNNSGLIDASRSVVITAEKINNATSRYGANQAAISAGNLIYLNASELGVINNDSAMMLTRNKDSAIQIDSGEFNNTTSSQIQKDEYSAGKKYITTLINPTGNVSSAGDLCINTSGNINLTGSSLSGAGKVVLDAKGNINASVIEDYSYEYKVDSKGGSGIFETKTTTVNEKEKLTNIGSFINSREGSVKMSGKNVNLQNTNIAGQSGVMLHADEDINLTTALNTDYQYSNKSKSNTFTGSQTWTKMSSSALNQGTKITSNGDINIEAGNNITAISAENNAVGSVNFISGGNTMFSAAQDCFIEESYHKKTDGLLGAVLNVDIGLKGISVGVSYKETTDREKTQNLTAVENKIISGGNIHTKAGKDVISFGTQMNAEGDISVEGQNILMMSAQNKKTKETSHEDTIVTTGIKIGNTYVDAGFAADAVVKSGEAVKKAKDEVSTMEDLYKQGKASKEALEDARINLAMATANLANATVGLTASISGAATAAGTSFGTGLYAAGFTNYETNKLSSIKEDNYATQSNLVSGTNITFKSANDMTQEGTNIHANQTLTYDIANDLTITASKDTSAQESKSEHISGGVSIGNNAVQVSAGYGQGSDRMRSTRHNNSQVTVNNIIMNVGNDALISGANIHAQNDLSINVGNNLTEESLQDTYYAKGNICDTNVNVGANFSGGKSIGGGFSTGNKYTDSAWVKQQTSLTSSGKAEINVGNKTTVTGAVIGSESGQMAFSTKELEYSNLEDRNVNRNQGFGINTSIGGNLTDQGALNLTPSGSTTLSFTKTGNEQHQTTKATIGKGTIIIDGSDTANDSKAPQELNRDLTNTQEITKDQITGALDSSITIDNRLLTSSGRASIGKDFKNFDKNVVKGASGVISTALSPITAVYSSLTAEGDGDKKIISAWKANQSANATGILRGGSKEAQEIITKIKEGAATLEEEQELANCTSSGKGNLIYSQIGEVADKETGELVLGFNDTSKQQGYVNVGNGAGTNALIFSLTDAEERAHNHTRNESIAKGAARSELGYFNAVSWLTGGNTIGDKDKSEAIEIIKYNTSNSKLNKTQQSNVREENKAYSLGSDIRTMYKGKKLPNGEIELNTIEEGISVFAEINPMGVVESVAGITSQIVGGVGVGEAIENQAKANVQESVETKKDPLDRLENELYSKDLIKDGINDIDNGKVGRGSAKLTLAGVNVLSNAMLVGAEVGAVKGLITENVIRKAGLKYVESGGKEIPSKAYRYVDPKDLVDPKDPKRESKIKREMKIPARDPENEKPTYLSFDKYDTPSPGKLQAPREASIRLEFKTKQIRDKIEVPKENYNDAKAKAYEPIVSYFKEYGKGGATQAITWSEIKIDKIVDLNKLQRNIERYDTLLGVTNTLKSANTAACRQNKALIEESNPNLDKNKK